MRILASFDGLWWPLNHRISIRNSDPFHAAMHLAWVSGSSTPSKMGSMPWWDLVASLYSGDHPMEDWKSSISTDSTGWWFQPTPLKKMMDFVSWDDDIPNMMGKSKKNMFQTTNQSYRQDWTCHTNDSKCEYINVSSGDLTFLHLFGCYNKSQENIRKPYDNYSPAKD